MLVCSVGLNKKDAEEISYELARVNKPNSKVQEIAPYNIAVTGTQSGYMLIYWIPQLQF